MKQATTNQQREPSETIPTARRPFLRVVAGLGAVGAFGLPTLATTVRAAIPGVSIEYKQCKVAFVSNASAIDSLAVYYADGDGVRQARYGIDSTVTDPQTYDPVVVKYNSDEDRTQVQLTEPQGALVCITAEAENERTTQVNPNDRCVPAGFNTAPTASFSISDDEPQVGDIVTLTSTATDPDEPERHHYEWDVDGDGVFETTGETATPSYTTPGDVTISHRVTDDCGAGCVQRSPSTPCWCLISTCSAAMEPIWRLRFCIDSPRNTMSRTLCFSSMALVTRLLLLD